jgi:hypothetical protein
MPFAVIAVLLVGALPAAAVDFNLTGGADFAGTIDEYDTDIATGYTLGLEVVLELSFMDVGAGVEYGFPRGTDLDQVDVDYRLAYAVGRIGIVGPVYLAARAGYADLSLDDLDEVDVKGGVAWSVGAGVDIGERLMVEAYLNNFSGDVDGLDSSFDYTTYSARLVFTF